MQTSQRSRTCGLTVVVGAVPAHTAMAPARVYTLAASGTAPCRHRNALRTRVRTPGFFVLPPDHAALRSSCIASRASERSHRRCARRPGKAGPSTIPSHRRVARQKHARAALHHGLFAPPTANSCPLVELIFSLTPGRASPAEPRRVHEGELVRRRPRAAPGRSSRHGPRAHRPLHAAVPVIS